MYVVQILYDPHSNHAYTVTIIPRHTGAVWYFSWLCCTSASVPWFWHSVVVATAMRDGLDNPVYGGSQQARHNVEVPQHGDDYGCGVLLS